MNIAFCINPNALVGFKITVSSLIRNCMDTVKLHIWILCSNIQKTEKDGIYKLFEVENFLGNWSIIDFNPLEEFSHFRSLHGDWTPYGLLLIPELIDQDTVLYLDSDLVVEVNVLELDNYNFRGHAVAAVLGGPISNTLENKFYIDLLGLSPHLDSFNSGILYMDLKVWRNKNLKEKCMLIARRFPMELLSCDQSLLNAVFAGDFAKLPAYFNCIWPSDKPKPEVAKKMILHFVGSPKPWDPFGSIIHNGYEFSLKYFSKEQNPGLDFRFFLNLKRIWKIRKSYVKRILKKLKN